VGYGQKRNGPFDCLPCGQPPPTFGHCQTSQTRSHEKSWENKAELNLEHKAGIENRSYFLTP